jgi:hypothetical protein
MTSSPDYDKAVETAKKAVENIEEPYKIPSFTAILSHILNGSCSTETIPRTKKVKTSEPKPKDNSEARPGPKSWIRELIAEGFFKKPKSSREILNALDERGHILTPQNVTRPLADLVNERLLRRKSMMPKDGKKKVMHWVNW